MKRFLLVLGIATLALLACVVALLRGWGWKEPNTAGALTAWNIGNGKVIWTISGSFPSSFSVSPDETRIAAIGSIGMVTVYNASTGQQILSVDPRLEKMISEPGSSVVFSPDSSRLVTAGVGDIGASQRNAPTSIWSATTGERVGVLRPIGPHQVGGANFDWRFPPYTAFSLDGNRILTVFPHYGTFSLDGTMLNTDAVAAWWDARSDTLLSTYYLASGGPRGGSLSPDGTKLLTANGGGCSNEPCSFGFWLWDANTGAPISAFAGERGDLGVQSAAFSRDGNLLVTASENGTARVWDLQAHRSIRTFPRAGSYVALSPDGSRLLTGLSRDGAKLWELSTGRLLRTFGADVGQVAFLAHGVQVVAAGEHFGSDPCFIATAAYGSPLAPHVESLRSFRDKYLATSRPGRALLRGYRRYSPPLAVAIAHHHVLRLATILALTPLVYTVEHPIPAWGFLLVCGLLAARRRSRREAERRDAQDPAEESEGKALRTE